MKVYQTNVLITKLKKAAKSDDTKLWARLAKEMEKPSRNQRSVNVAKLQRYAQEGLTLVVPGKVLAAGMLDQALQVAAFSYSEQAKSKIEAQKGKAMTVEELLEKNPKAKKVKIIA